MSKWIAAGIAAFASALLFVSPADALGPVVPDPDDFRAAQWVSPRPIDNRVGNGYLVVAEIWDGQVIQLDQTNVKVYFNNNNGTKQVRIHHGDLCRTIPSHYGRYDEDDLVGIGDVRNDGNGHIARYRALKVRLTADGEEPTNTVLDQAFGRYRPAVVPPDDCGNKTLNIPGNQLVYSPNVDRWVAYIRADRLGRNGVNVFRVTAVGGTAGMIGKIDARELGINVIGHANLYTNYDLKFAPDCSLTRPGFERVELYDPDNGRPHAQPLPFRFSILERDRATGQTRLLDRDEYRNPSLNSWNPGSKSWQPNFGLPSNTYTSVEARFQPDKQYFWRFYNVYDRNNIQFRIPFDQIYFEVPCQPQFELQPQIEASPSDLAIIPNPINFRFFIDNRDSGSPQLNTRYDLRIYDGNNNNIIPPRNNVSVTIPAGNQHYNFFNHTINPTTTNMGGRVCAVLTIHPSDSSNPNSSERDGPVCVTIGKAPHVQVRGGDVWAGGSLPDENGACPTDDSTTGIRGSRTFNIGGETYGSWGEYGVLSLGGITTYGSAGQAAAASAGAQLTFANTPGLGLFGGNNPSDHCLTNLFGKYSGGTVRNNQSLNVTSLGSGVYDFTNVDELHINNGNARVQGGRDVVIRANKVVIESNILYANGPASSLADIPRIIILADEEIIINGNVTQVDSWLSTRETLFTCNVAGPLSGQDCNSRLEINGVVIADTIALRRTAGGDSGSPWMPAEIFNLRANDYLRAYGDSLQNSTQQTVYQKELPPRY